MSITKLQNKILRDFRAGRVSSKNMTAISPEHALIAKNVFLLGDGDIRRRKGYTLVQDIGTPVTRMFDFHRQSDQLQWLALNYGTNLALAKADGSAAPTVLSAVEDATKPFSFATNPYELFCSNGVNSYALYNDGGVEKKRQWGIDMRPTAPGINTSTTGSLRLTYGRQYVVCDVTKWTDSKGVSRYHIGPPSPWTAHSGPVTNKVVTLTGITASANPAVTHKWIFATPDQPADSISAYLFAAEITNGTTSWGDTLTDDQLDTTRVAPFDNYPAPKAQWLLEYESRIVAIGILDDPDSVYCSAYEEIDLGIPQECWPTTLRWRVPGGLKKITGGIVFDQSLMIGTPEYWFQIRGTNAEDFVKRDRIAAPGPVGFKAVAVAGNLLIWLGPDKKLWGWDGANLPIELSNKLAQAQRGMLSMEDISDAQLENAELKVFSWGRYHFVMLCVSTDGNAGYDWIQLWDATSFVNSDRPLSDGSQATLAEADMVTAHRMQAVSNVLVGNTQYMFMAGTNGRLYRWPDGYSDADAKIPRPRYATPFLDLDMPGVTKRLMWADISTDRDDSKGTFTVSAVVSDDVNLSLDPLKLKLGNKPAPYGVDKTLMRASLQQKGTAIGRWLQLIIDWPDDTDEATVEGIDISSIPLSKTNP